MGIKEILFKKRKELTDEEAEKIVKDFIKENERLIKNRYLLLSEAEQIERNYKNWHEAPFYAHKNYANYVKKALEISREIFDKAEEITFNALKKLDNKNNIIVSNLIEDLVNYARIIDTINIFNYDLIEEENEREYSEDNFEELVNEIEELNEEYGNEIKTYTKYLTLNFLKSYYEDEGEMDKISEIIPLIKEIENELDKSSKKSEKINKNSPEKFEEEIEKKKNITTSRGLKVNSQGEKAIAEFLDIHYIDYDYDKQITLKGNQKNKRGFDTTWCRPDFYLNEFNLIIEYWGLKGQKDYDSKMEEKKRLYKEAEIPFISIFPEDLIKLEEILRIKLERFGCKI